MKPHLPIALLAALMGAVAAQAAEIPDDYEQIDLWVPSYLDDYTSNTADDQYAFILGTDVNFTPSTNEIWTSTTPLVSGGNLIFSTAEGYDPLALSFSKGADLAFNLNTASDLRFDTLSNLTFADIVREKTSTSSTRSFYGSALYLGKNATLTINQVNDNTADTTDVLFSGNQLKVTSSSSYHPYAYGGAIYGTTGSVINITENGDVSFSNNLASAYSSTGHTPSYSYSYGSGICTAGNITFSGNGDISFSNNLATSSASTAYDSSSSYSYSYSYGGGVNTVGNTTFSGNGDISFNNNRATSSATASFYDYARDAWSYGGAVYTGGIWDMQGNGDILFSGNYASAKTIYFDNSSSYYVRARGGAIYSTSAINLSGNANLEFSGNYTTASSKFRSSYYTSFSQGGAIYATGDLTISNNADVTFRGNYADNRYNSATYTQGGAIYSTGSVVITGNDDVVFEKNYQRYGATSYTYRLRSIYMGTDAATDALVLSAKAGKSITFNDSVYMAYYSGATVSFNADYEDADGKTQKATGDIIFSGLHTADHLKEIKGGVAGTSTEITNSQTSVINNHITLYGGSLQVVDGAKLNGHGLTVAAGSDAELLLRNSSMSHSGYNFTFNSGTTLELQGLNTITASKVILGSGAALTVSVGADNLSTAALTLGGTDLSTSQLTVNLNRTDGLTSGMYKIISQNSASDFTTSSAWTEENVTVVGSGDADRATFGDLVWQNGTLYYNVGRNIWSNASEDRLWNTCSDNWTMNDRSYTYKDGMDVYFTDLGAGDVKLVGDVTPAGIEVNNSEGNDYSFSASESGGKLVGSTGITKNGAGALTISTANTHTGATVLNAGTLNLHHSTALGNTAAGGTATLTTLADTTLNVDNNSHVVLAGENSIAGNVGVAAGSTLEMRNSGYAATASTVDGTLAFNGTASAAANVGSLTGTGTVRVNDSTVTFASQSKFTGNLLVSGTDASLTVTSGAYSSAGTLSAEGNGATLNLGENNVSMKSGGSIRLAAQITEAATMGAKLIANNVSLAKGSTLSVEGVPSALILSEISGADYSAVSTPETIANSASVGLADVSKLTINSGATYEALYGNLSMNGGELTLAVPSATADKILLNVYYDVDYTDDMQVVLFTDAFTANFIYNGQAVSVSGTDVLTLDASDYFAGEAINDDTQLVYDNGTIYLTGVNNVIPEPATVTLSFLALAAFAARRNRK